MTVLEVIKKGAEFLTRKGVDSPRLQVELLLAHVMGVQRLKLYLDFERVLSGAEEDRMRELLRRRGDREPLQYLLGSACFCGLELRVDRRVLVPRPETEQLAERAWEWLGKRVAAGAGRPRVLDFGTGSGCLAVAVAVKCPEAELHAVDLSEEALAVARENAARHGVEGRIRFYAGDGFQGVPAGLRFDLVMSNPPYVPSGYFRSLQVEVRMHEPRLALDGGKDGLRFYRLLAEGAAGRMEHGGRMLLELGYGQAEEVSELMAGSGWVVEGVEEDHAGLERFLIARRKE